MWQTDVPDIEYLIGLDPAQGGLDYTAIAVVERREFLAPESVHQGEPATYDVVHLDRWRDARTARIPETIEHLIETIQKRRLRFDLDHRGFSKAVQPTIRLVVDITGSGPFITDPLRQAGLNPISIQIHGGESVTSPKPSLYRTPKRDLASVLAVTLGTDRLRIASALPLASILRAELENFRVRISLSGHDSYEAGSGAEWREGEHDDLVLALGCAVWLGEYSRAPRLDPGIARAFHGLRGHRRC